MSTYCRSRTGYGRCGRKPHKGDPLHAVPIAGGTDPVSDRAVWFVYGRGITAGYRVAKLMVSHERATDEIGPVS